MQSSLAERRAFIQSFVKEVRVTDGKVLLLYKIPPATGEDSKRLGRGSFYCTKW